MDGDKAPLYNSVYPTTQIQSKEIAMSSIQPTSVPLPQPGPTTILTHQHPGMVLLGPENTVTVCQFCRASIKTAVKYTTTARTHIAAALCGLLCCCCCIPYASNSARNSDHYCPNCQKYLGTYANGSPEDLSPPLSLAEALMMGNFGTRVLESENTGINLFFFK